MYWWRYTVVVVMNRALGNVPFSLKFKGAEALTPKECCDGLETMASWRDGFVGIFWMRHANSAHLWQVNLLVPVARRYSHQHQELREAEGCCSCVLFMRRSQSLRASSLSGCRTPVKSQVQLGGACSKTLFGLPLWTAFLPSSFIYLQCRAPFGCAGSDSVYVRAEESIIFNYFCFYIKNLIIFV